MKLKRDFYNQPTIHLAQDLLGKFLVHRCTSKGSAPVRKYRGKKIIGQIVETEAYVGPKDKASHASRGRTQRTEIMFGPAGCAYVYLIYGMYYCLNIVTGREGYPAAVLIRACAPPPHEGAKTFSRLRGADRGVASGPGKLCKYFKIDKKINGLDLTGNVLWLEDRGAQIKKSQIVRAKRIGVDYAEEYKDKPWRFYIKGNKFVSK